MGRKAGGGKVEIPQKERARDFHFPTTPTAAAGFLTEPISNPPALDTVSHSYTSMPPEGYDVGRLYQREKSVGVTRAPPVSCLEPPGAHYHLDCPRRLTCCRNASTISRPSRRRTSAKPKGFSFSISNASGSNRPNSATLFCGPSWKLGNIFRSTNCIAWSRKPTRASASPPSIAR